MIAAPKWMVARKPKHGEACNDCGLCCFARKCDIGRALFGGDAGPCPAVRFDADHRSRCDVIANPQNYSRAEPEAAREAAKLILYAGEGCTMRINGEMNLAFNNRLDRRDESRRGEMDDAHALWGLKGEDRW